VHEEEGLRKQKSEFSDQDLDLHILSKKEFLEDFLIETVRSKKEETDTNKPEEELSKVKEKEEESKFDIDVEEAISMLEDLNDDNDSLEDPFAYGTENIMKEIM